MSAPVDRPAPSAGPRPGAWALLLAAATAAVYWRVAGYPFLWFDDNHYVTENLFVRAGLTARGLRWAFCTNDGNYWHPLAFVSHMADVSLFGLDAGAHHLVSAGLHLANVLLVFALLRFLTRDDARSAFVAGVFALHPLQVESVAWIAERKTVLAAFFLLLSLRAYAGWARGAGARAYAAALLLCALSLAAKPLGVAVPALVLLLEYWPLGRLAREPGRCLAAAAPFAGLAAASALATRETAVFVSAVPLSRRLENVPIFLVRYLGKAVWPARLSPFYPYPESAPSLPAVLGCLLALAALTAGAALARRRRPALLAGWLWFLAALLPVSGLVAVGAHSIADRFMYLPLLGLAMAAAWAVPPGLERAAAPAAAAALAALAVVSGARARVWRGDVPLFSDAARVEPDSPLIRLQLGFGLMKAGRWQEAEAQYRRALELRPDYAEARQYLGVVLAAEGRLEEARGELSRALVDARGPLAAQISSELQQLPAKPSRRRGGGHRPR